MLLCKNTYANCGINLLFDFALKLSTSNTIKHTHTSVIIRTYEYLKDLMFKAFSTI